MYVDFHNCGRVFVMSINLYRAAAVQPRRFDKRLTVCPSVRLLICLHASVKRVHCDRTIATYGNILII